MFLNWQEYSNLRLGEKGLAPLRASREMHDTVLGVYSDTILWVYVKPINL